MIYPEALLLLPHLLVQNANAIASPLTWGFPSPSAFTGFVHALQRNVASDLNVKFEGVGIVCHHFEAQASQPSGKRTRVFHLTRNPVGKSGETLAIVEEGRANLEISLLIGVSGAGLDAGMPREELAAQIWDCAMSMRIAGGSICPPTQVLSKWERPRIDDWPGTPAAEQKLSRAIASRLLPGFAIVSRENLLAQRFAELRALDDRATELDALLDLTSLSYDPPLPSGESETANDRTPQSGWHIRSKEGWLVPIPAGYQGISELYPPGVVENVRDRNTPFRFVEGVYSIGQWLSPHRVKDVRQLLWVHQTDLEKGIYRWTTPHFAALNASKEGN
ncbi:MAG: type I-F CRISPR-associated protein Csy2 [Polyangiaceae bacterium]|nr:type I-F CRISPR-associated protein Csy2 [Polyangiaceae bacterium]